MGGASSSLASDEAGLLAAGEDRDLLEDVVLAEEEAAEDLARHLLGHVPVDVPHLHRLLHHRLGGVEVVHPVLREIARHDVAAELAHAALDRDDPAQDLQQGGLAGAVGPDEHDALAALGREIEVAVDDVVAVGLLHVLQVDDLPAGAGRLGKLEIDPPQVLLRLVHGHLLQALDLLLLRLGPRGQRGLGAEPVDEFLQVGDLALLVLEPRRLLLLAFVLLPEEIVVVARVALEGAPAQFEDAGAEGVQERAVVRDDDEAARVPGEVLLEPEQGLQIEMVRRLVQEEEGRLAHQQAGQMGAHDPAAGKRLGELVTVALAKTEAGEDLLGPRLQRVVDVVVVVGLGLELGPARGDMENGLVARRRAFLGQETEVRAPFPGDGALVGRLLAEDQVKERRLAGAIRSHQPIAVGPGHENRDILEEDTGTVGLGDVGESEHANRQANQLGAEGSMMETRPKAGNATPPRQVKGQLCALNGIPWG